jgi:hypothetical protein
MTNKNNVVDFGKFREQKGAPAFKSQDWVAVINDRLAFRLRADKKLETIEGERVVETRPATYAEMQLIAQNTFMEAMIVDLVRKYEPHRQYDDYLFYPYTDWSARCQEVGPEAVAWNEGFIDAPLVTMQRTVYCLIDAVRQRVAEKGYPGKVGLMPQQVGDNHKDLTSDLSNYYFRIEDVDAIADNRFKATMYRKEGREQADAAIKKGEIDLTAFRSEQDRVDYLAVVLTSFSDTVICDFTEHAVQYCGGSFYIVE